MRFSNRIRVGFPKLGLPARSQAGMTLVEVVIALAITAVTVGGIVTGYNYCLTCSVKDSLYMAANGRAAERIEEARSAPWNNSSDQLVSTNFPDEVVTLDEYAASSNILTATIQTQISQISTVPPVRRIHVDCVWWFKGTQLITNSIETCRTEDR